MFPESDRFQPRLAGRPRKEIFLKTSITIIKKHNKRKKKEEKKKNSISWNLASDYLP